MHCISILGRMEKNLPPLKTKGLFWKAGLFWTGGWATIFEGNGIMLVDGATCHVLSSRQLTSACCLQLWQNSSLKWPLSAPGIFQKYIETVHPRKCDFTVSKTLDLVIKRLNTCCLFFWQQWFLFILHFWSWAKWSLYRILSDFVLFFIWKFIVSFLKKDPITVSLCFWQ